MGLPDQVDDALQALWRGDSGAFQTLLGDLGDGGTPIEELCQGLMGARYQPGLHLEPGGEIEGFRILREIGHGGMGVVYAAEQKHPQRSVALKLIRPGIASDGMLRRFEHEVRLLARLQHPGIAQLFEAGTLQTAGGPQPYFVMELVEGRRLLEYARERGLDVRQRLELFCKVCDAVQHAHQRGVIHRDLKPANILVVDVGAASDRDTRASRSETAPTAQPKILDFGVARATEGDAATTLQTLAGQLIGTVPYMSPEQVTGDPREIDTRSDVYSLGVVLYELLSGALPHNLTNCSIPEAARRIRDEAPRRIGTLNRALRGEVEIIVAKTLEKGPDRRYPSAAELAAEIRRYLHDEPISARRPSTIYQLRKAAVRHKALTTFLVSSVIVVAAFGVWMSLLYRQADRLRSAADQQAGRAHQTQLFLEKMLSSIDPEVAKGQDTSLIRAILAEAAGKVGAELAEQPEAEADIRATIGTAYLSVGLAKEAQSQLETALAIRRKLLGEEHDAVASTLRLLAECAAKQGDRERAETLARQALALRRKQFGSGDIKVAEALQTLGWIVSELGGNRVEAASLLRESLEIITHLSDQEHPLYAHGLHTLAVVLWRWPKLDEAESAARETLALKQRSYGVEHPSVARAMDLLGQILTSKVDYAAAEPIIRESLEMHRRLFGEEHPAFASSLNSLVHVHMGKGDYTAAEPLARQCLELLRRVRGESSHETAMQYLILANILDKQGDDAEALPLYRIADERFRTVFPSDHPYVHSPLTRLAEMLDKHGKHEEAEPLWRQLLEETRLAFPPGHPQHNIFLGKAGGLGRCLLDLGRCEDAETPLLECYEGLLATRGAQHKETLKAAADLVRLYGDCGPEEKAADYRKLLESAAATAQSGSLTESEGAGPQ